MITAGRSGDRRTRSLWSNGDPYEPTERLGLDDFHPLSGAECQQLVYSERLRLGHFEDETLLVDPAAPCRGLRDETDQRCVRVYENTPVDAVVETEGRLIFRGVVATERAGRQRLAQVEL
ncbi:MAG: hypothetical protein ACYCS7_02530 [Acidimicrobiales bacterium]